MKNHADDPGQFHPAFSRTLIEEAGLEGEKKAAKVNQDKLDKNSPADPGATGWQLDKLLKEARTKAAQAKAKELAALTGAQL